jgi:hypothetical protein
VTSYKASTRVHNPESRAEFDDAEGTMPERETLERARKDKREGKSPSTQAGEFVREEVHHIREGKHGARSAKQAVAIGLSKARRAGVKLPPPKTGSARAKRAAKTATSSASRTGKQRPSAKRSRAVTMALRREGRAAGSSRALAKQARASARRRSASQRSSAAKRAAVTKGAAGRSAAARKAARTRAKG